MPRDEARAQVRDLLALANGDADAVFRSLDRSARATRQAAGCTPEEAAEAEFCYGMMLLALADLTDGASYRL